MGVSSSCWIDIGNQNINGNYTWCVFRGDVTASGASHNNYTKTGSGNFDGTAFTFSTTIPANTTKRMFDFGKDVYHDADGNKYVSGSFSLNTGISAGTITGNSGRQLPTIPRASDISNYTNSTGYVDGTFNVKFTPKANGFYYKIRISIPNIKQICKRNIGTKNNVEQNIAITLSADELNLIYDNVPNASSCPIGIIVETYSDSGYTNNIGNSRELTKTMKLPASLKPKINSVTAEGINTYQEIYYIKGRSKCKVTVDSVTLSRGATIKSYTYSYDTIRKTSTSNTYTTAVFNIGTMDLDFKVTVTDSRGMTATHTFSILCYDYKVPIVKMTLYRCDENKNRDDINGTYIYIKPVITLSNVPDNQIIARYINIDGTIVTRNFESGSVLALGTYSIDTEHTVICAIKDSVGSTTKITRTISMGKIPMNINKDKTGIAFGKYSTKADTVEMAYTLDLSGGFTIKGENFWDLIFPKGYQMFVSDPNFNPNSKYPGTTWKRLKGVVLGAINESDTDTNDKTSFNQKAGTIIGSKYLQQHNHPFKNGSNTWFWGDKVGGTVYCPTEATAGSVPSGHNYITTKQDVWNSSDNAGNGDAQNIQPTQLTYIWEKTS